MAVDVIIKIREGYTIADCAEEAKDLFGRGGWSDAKQSEDYLGIVNTPPCGPNNEYVRVRVDEDAARIMEYLAQDMGGETAELVIVLWPGVEEPDISWPVPIYDENGVQIDTGVGMIGRFA